MVDPRSDVVLVGGPDKLQLLETLYSKSMTGE
jgi:hypothetical protein